MRCVMHVRLDDDSSLLLLNRVMCGIATHVQGQADQLQELRHGFRYALDLVVPDATQSQRPTRSSATTRTSQRGYPSASAAAAHDEQVKATGQRCLRALAARGYHFVAKLAVRRRDCLVAAVP